MDLTVIPSGQLPKAYQAAKASLSECAQIDECQTWADKAAALASYAKQADDDELLRLATRIRARAIRRAGELLKQIEPDKGGRPPETSAGDHTSFTRTDAARDAGMSKHQQVQATRVASIPEPEFEAQVESPKPPTVTALAKQGTKKQELPEGYLGGRDGKIFNRILHFVGGVEMYCKDMQAAKFDDLISQMTPSEADRLRKSIAVIDAIHDKIVTRI